MEAFQVSTERLADRTVAVKVNGELDVLTAPQLQTALHGELTNGTARTLVDLSECTFIDSAGIRTLWDAGSLAQDNGLEPLTVITDDPYTLRLFELIDLPSHIRVRPTREGALHTAPQEAFRPPFAIPQRYSAGRPYAGARV